MAVETPEYAAMLERMLKAYGKRVGNGDPVDLGRMLELLAVLEGEVLTAMRGQRDAGFSWAEIGEGMGTSKQNAEQRFRRLLGRLSVVAS